MDTTEIRHELPVYTISGTLDVGQFWMVAVEFNGDGVSAVSTGMHEERAVRLSFHLLCKPVATDRAS